MCPQQEVWSSARKHSAEGSWFSAPYSTVSLSFLLDSWQLRFAQILRNMLILLLVSGAFGIFKNSTGLLKSVIFPEELSITGVLFSL